MANMTMEEVMASLNKGSINLTRGQQVKGVVVAITDSEVILDLGAKSEGVLAKRELPTEKSETLKQGDELTVYVISSESPSGQVTVSYTQHFDARSDFRSSGSFRGSNHSRGGINLSRFSGSIGQVFKGRVSEVNKGGLVVEVEGARGFLPASQVRFGQANSLEELTGKEIEVEIKEVDPENNKLIVSQKGPKNEQLANFKPGQNVQGQVKAVMPFGLVVALEGEVEGLVHISDVSWERTEDLGANYQTGQELEAQVVGMDESLGRVNLSLKALKSDPFIEFAKNHQGDDVITGTYLRSTDNGSVFSLTDGVEGLLHTSRQDASIKYSPSQKVQLLIDNIDSQRRRISLAPFITSTEGLIYK